MSIYDFEGTLKSEVFFGKTSERIGIRTNSGVAEYRDYGGTWTSFSSMINLFEKSSSVIRETAVTGYSNSFLIGSPQMDDDGDTSHDYRMFYDKSTGAFRAGQCQNTYWDAACRGVRSVAFGGNTQAYGKDCLAGGFTVRVGGNYAFGWGSSLDNYGIFSVAFGDHVTLSSAGDYSVAMGRYNSCDSPYSAVVGGYNAISSGSDYSFCSGYNNTVSVDGGFASGRDCISTVAYGRVSSSGKFADDGDCQHEYFHVFGTTENTITPTVIYPNNDVANAITVPNDRTVYNYTARIIGVVQDATLSTEEGNVIDIKLEGTIKRDTTMTLLREVKTVIYTDTGMEVCDATVAVSGADSVSITVTGRYEGATVIFTIRWSGTIRFHNEVRY